jgi:argininosuccinate lyase
MRERINVELAEYFKNEILLLESIRDYEFGFRELILINKAYAIMLEKKKIIDTESSKIILNGLSYVEETLKVEDIDGKYEDIHFNVEQALINKIGRKVGGKLHAGRSRNDMYASLTRMEVRKSIWLVLEKIIELQEILLQKAEENLETVITGYTHMQPGQPITVGHYYTAIVNALMRDFERLTEAYKNTNVSPYGAGAFAGTSFPVDRELLCRLLGFDDILVNSIDCIASKDFLLQVEMAYTIMMINISRFAEDLYFWSTDDCGILDVGGEISICSSIMPQKKNPVSLEYAKSKAGHCIGGMISAVTTLKNVPFSNNMDIFEASAMYFEAHSQLVQGISMLTETIRYSKIRKERAFEKAKKNFCTVTGLADYLVKTYYISFDEAHHIVGSMVAEAIESDLGIEGMTSALLKEISAEVLGHEIVMKDEEISTVLDPFNNVQSKQAIGGPNIESVKAMIKDANIRLENEKVWLKGIKEHVANSYKEIEAEEKRIIG